MIQTAAKRVVRELPSVRMFNPAGLTQEAPKMVVAAYARVSTEKEEQEDSFERQVEHYTVLIQSKSEWGFGGIYADPGITGTRAEKRPDFMRMITDCRAGKIQKILVKSISRFARNTVDALCYIRELKDLGISIYFESENIDTLTPGGEVLITILAAMAEQESRTMSTNIKWSYQKKFQQGEVTLNTGLMLGYTKVGTGNEAEYIINEKEAEIVRRIYREYLAGITVTRIGKGLEDDGILTKLGKPHWHTSVILNILQNEKYTGNAILGKTFKPDVLSKRRQKNAGQVPMYYAENTHPAIIDKEQFDMAAAEIVRRKSEKETAVGSSRYTSKYPFSGLLVCGFCGVRLRRHVRRVGSGKMVAAWGCANRIINGRAKCNSHHINEDALQRTYIAAIRAMIDDADNIMETIRESAGLTLAPANHDTLNTVANRIIEIQQAVLELHKAKLTGGITDGQYNDSVKEYGEEMKRLETQQTELQTAETRYSAVSAWLTAFGDHIKSGSILDADDDVIIKQLVEKIIVRDTDMEIRFKCGGSITQKYE